MCNAETHTRQKPSQRQCERTHFLKHYECREHSLQKVRLTGTDDDDDADDDDDDAHHTLIARGPRGAPLGAAHSAGKTN